MKNRLIETVLLLLIAILCGSPRLRKQTLDNKLLTGNYYCSYHVCHIADWSDAHDISYDSIVGYDTLSIGISDIDSALMVNGKVCRFFPRGTHLLGPAVIPPYAPALYFFADDSIYYQQDFYFISGRAYYGRFYTGRLISQSSTYDVQSR